ncbi:unnamed protein product [Linum tenue]|uniref:Uncharacterized protein n=1 Tax=Linum tenue TaxID=586396 RepID=A0AAV0HNN5_9ROSI|nr:unnamed protein product [Linum tenue]
MAEASNGRVTITLGPSGQVVKRAVSAAGYSDSLLGAGGKRSVRDRLGGDSEGSMYRGDKRHRSDSYLTAANSAGVRDARIGKGDLRFKLLQKNVGRRDQSDDDKWDLRDKLSKKAQSLSHPPAVLGTGELMSYPRETSLLGGIPPSGSSSELSRREPSRNSYSPWTLDHIRRRSPGRIITASTPPDRGISTSRGFSPPRHVDEGQRRSLGRSIDDVRPVSYMTRDVRDAPRSMSSSTHFMPKPGLPTVSTKSAAPISAPVAPASNVPEMNSRLLKACYIRLDWGNMPSFSKLRKGLGRRFFSPFCLVLKGNLDDEICLQYNMMESTSVEESSDSSDSMQSSNFAHWTWGVY